MNRSLLAAIAAFVMWGLFPLYWHQLAHLNPLTISAHRNVWCLAALILWLPWMPRPWARAQPTTDQNDSNPAAPAQHPWGKILAHHLLSGLLLAANWFIFIWANTSGHIIDGSMGYFLNPLVSIALGTLFLGEKLSTSQRLAVLLAILGVALPLITLGHFPWIAVSLALSFALYGLMGKKSPVHSQAGLFVESLLLLPFALIILNTTQPSGWAILSQSPTDATLLILGGLVTLLPLLFFGAAARGLPLSTLGIVQFITPTLQFLIGWAIYHEPMHPSRWLSFALIWTGVILYLIDLQRQRQTDLKALS